MANHHLAASQSNSLVDLANGQRDTEASLRLYFGTKNPDFIAIFAGQRQSEVKDKLDSRLSEAELRSILAVLAGIEAAFRLDYQWRRSAKRVDSVSVAFRRYRKSNVRLDEEIWETWRAHHPTLGLQISQLRGAMKFRHWLAHGRYWQIGHKYDFQTVYLIAEAVLADFPLFS